MNEQLKQFCNNVVTEMKKMTVLHQKQNAFNQAVTEQIQQIRQENAELRQMLANGPRQQSTEDYGQNLYNGFETPPTPEVPNPWADRMN